MSLGKDIWKYSYILPVETSFSFDRPVEHVLGLGLHLIMPVVIVIGLFSLWRYGLIKTWKKILITITTLSIILLPLLFSRICLIDPWLTLPHVDVFTIVFSDLVNIIVLTLMYAHSIDLYRDFTYVLPLFTVLGIVFTIVLIYLLAGSIIYMTPPLTVLSIIFLPLIGLAKICGIAYILTALSHILLAWRLREKFILALKQYYEALRKYGYRPRRDIRKIAKRSLVTS
ncbi:MAG: hypothetical protein GXO10_06410 [Crenarchaeota archaeon]|nr:hypothetical protein [Thermoproteota archaeon]